ncbi:hypothetical protein BYT27DRAFT_7197508 [Phlegmacium glaucopus]|nr:hypothetical protein BYT27DRAFT_7197508 [Phlegmacium glaucopus]
MPRVEDLSSVLGPSALSGRWIKSSKGSLRASWSSSSVSFFFSGTKLSLQTGPRTERQLDMSNGETPMIGIRVGPTEEAVTKNSAYWRTADPGPNSEVLILDEKTHPKLQKKTFVQIMVIDWVSTFELSALIYNDGGRIEPLPANFHDGKTNILFIGDSISSGFAVPVEEGGEPVPFGVLDIFPFIAQRKLLEKQSPLNVAIDLVAYPGFTLVTPTEQEKEEGLPPGMNEAFFDPTPWGKESFEIPWPDAVPKAIVIELGTNDQCFDIPAERFATAMEGFVTKLAKMFEGPLQYIWLVPPFPDKDTENQELKLAFPSLVARLKAKLTDKLKVDVCDLVEGLTVEGTVDGVHPKLAVHLEIGKKLADFISSNLDKGDL